MYGKDVSLYLAMTLAQLNLFASTFTILNALQVRRKVPIHNVRMKENAGRVSMCVCMKESLNVRVQVFEKKKCYMYVCKHVY